MLQHKKFLDIKVADTSTIGGFEIGDYIIIQTKIDGANAAIRYDSETDKVVAQSRKQILDSSNNLRGFYEFTQLLDKERVKFVLGDRYVLYGEYTAPHTVVYAEEFRNKFYAYDCYDLAAGKWLPQGMAREMADKIGLPYVFVWYEGDFICWEHCKQFLTGTVYGEEQSEGIVVKNMTKLNDPNNRHPFYVKIVNEKFKETTAHKGHRQKSADELAKFSDNLERTQEIVTRARVEKILHKGVDEGIIPENWSAEDMRDIAKYVPKEVVQDCFKEENDTVAEIDEFTKFANKVTMTIVKEILAEKSDTI